MTLLELIEGSNAGSVAAAQGSEAANQPGRIVPGISFSQREPNLVRFAVDQFRELLSGNVYFVFSLGEDSAFFMAGEGAAALDVHHRGLGLAGTPVARLLAECCPELNEGDRAYLAEVRADVIASNEDHLA